MSYIDYNDWKIEEIANDIRVRISEAKKQLPKKVMKHFIEIRYKTGHNCYTYGYRTEWMFNHSEFSNTNDAIDFLNSKKYLVRIGDNMWVDCCGEKTYLDENGNEVQYHYEIVEYDAEVYEDGEYHTEYTDDELEALRCCLFSIEKARKCLRAYEKVENDGSYGNNSFAENLFNELKQLDENFTEELPEDYNMED